MNLQLFDDVSPLGDYLPTGPGDAPVTAAGLVLASLLSDARDQATDEAEPRGWWGDAYATDGDRFGSRLWTITGPVTDELLRRVEAYSLEALEWMKADGYATAIGAEASRVDGAPNRVALSISIDGEPPLLLFGDLS
jgi:phage gp46-like protein